MNRKETILAKTHEYEQLLERAHALGTELRKTIQDLPACEQQNDLFWRISRSQEQLTSAQTYAMKFRHYANNHLNQYENE